MSHQSGLIGEGGASVAENPAALLPCLKERTWSGRELAACRVLWAKTASAYMPWVAVGYDSPHSFTFINTKDLAGMQTTEAALEARALENLRRRPATWEKVDIEATKESRFTMLACSGDFLAAERILVPEFMKEAQRTLRARGLLVGIPRRGRLFCIDGEGLSVEAFQAFGILVAQEFASGTSAQISPALFAVKDGEIVDLVELIADSMMPELERARDEEEEEEEGGNSLYFGTIVVQNDLGTQDVTLMVGGVDADEFVHGLQHGFVQVLHKQLERKEFSGTMNVVVLGYTPDEAKNRLPEVITHLRGYCDEVSKTIGKPIRVTLEVQEDSFGVKTKARPAAMPAAAAAVPVEGPAPSLLTRVIVWIIVVVTLISLKELTVSLFP